MIRAHKIRLNPTDEQAAFLTKCCHTNRAAYNWALAKWQEWRAMGAKPSAMELKRLWNDQIDRLRPWARESFRDAYASAFDNLGDAFSRYFAGQNDYPKFKKRGKSRMSFTLANDKFSVEGYTAKLPKIGAANMAEALRFAGKIVRGTVSMHAGHWYLSITVQMSDAPRAKTGRRVGVDVGLKTLAVTSVANGNRSDGEQLENQKPLKNSLTKLRRLNRSLSRKVLGGRNWQKATIKLARHHERIANKRRDIWHKFTSSLASRYDTVCIEDLNIKGMTKNKRLSRAIADAGWAIGFAMLDYKCTDVRRVPRFAATSKPCNECGRRKENLTLADRVWLCACGNVVDRDLNAAKNILEMGIAQPSNERPQVVATSRVKRSRTARKTASAASQVEVGTSMRAHLRTF
ncbi:MAG: transposase [Anaerolineae bacterium]|nr:transposase [Anaerolineae bacterium]